MLLAEKATEDADSGADELDEVLRLGEVAGGGGGGGETVLGASCACTGVLDVAEYGLEDVEEAVLRICYPSGAGSLDIIHDGTTASEFTTEWSGIEEVGIDYVLRASDRGTLACTRVLDIAHGSLDSAFSGFEQYVPKAMLWVHGEVMLRTESSSSFTGTGVLYVTEETTQNVEKAVLRIQS